MADLHNFCPYCMSRIEEELDICPVCGKAVKINQGAPYLPAGTVLGNKYVVGRKIDEYGDGVTYLGFDLKNNRVVNIREYLPVSIIKRTNADLSIKVKIGSEEIYSSCYQSFVRMWMSLMRIRVHFAAPAVLDVLMNVNLTAYAVTEHFDGIPLNEYVSSLGYPGNILPWNHVKDILLPLLPELESLNAANFFHLCLSPASVFVDSNGGAYISRFCIPQLCRNESSLPPYFFSGFAAFEQYALDRKCGSWTDVYSFTAILFNLLTGFTPPDAVERVTNGQLMIQQDVACSLPKFVIHALFNGLKVLPQERIDSIAKLRTILSPEPPAVRLSDAQQQPENTSVAAPAKSAAEPDNSDAGYDITQIPQKDEPYTDDDENGEAPEETFDESDDNKKDKKNKKKDKKDKKESGKSKKKGSHTGVAGVLAFICSLLFAALAFLVLYPTVLYTKVSIPLLDPLYEYIPALPVNSYTGTRDGSDTTTDTTKGSAIDVSSVQNGTITVADFLKSPYSSIKDNPVFNSNYKISVKEEHSEKPKGVIISQSLVAGTKVPVGSAITLVVSLGPEDVMLEYVVGMTYDEAYKKLTDAGFVVEKTVLDNNGTEKADEVSNMSPAAETEYPYGTKVILKVWGAVANAD